MGIAIGAALATVAFAIIIWPLLRHNAKADIGSVVGSVDRERLHSERLSIYRRMIDLKEDRKNGDIADDEWQTQMDRLRLSAAQLMHEEERLGVPKNAEAELEKEIARTRSERKLEQKTGSIVKVHAQEEDEAAI